VYRTRNRKQLGRKWSGKEMSFEAVCCCFYYYCCYHHYCCYARYNCCHCYWYINWCCCCCCCNYYYLHGSCVESWSWYGEPSEWLNFGEIWSWPLTLTAVLISFRQRYFNPTPHPRRERYRHSSHSKCYEVESISPRQGVLCQCTTYAVNALRCKIDGSV